MFASQIRYDRHDLFIIIIIINFLLDKSFQSVLFESFWKVEEEMSLWKYTHTQTQNYDTVIFIFSIKANLSCLCSKVLKTRQILYLTSPTQPQQLDTTELTGSFKRRWGSMFFSLNTYLAVTQTRKKRGYSNLFHQIITRPSLKTDQTHLSVLSLLLIHCLIYMSQWKSARVWKIEVMQLVGHC